MVCYIDNVEVMWSGLCIFCMLMMIGVWSIALQWDVGVNVLMLVVISCVFYFVVVVLFKLLLFLMCMLVLLLLFSFVVKFGLMV